MGPEHPQDRGADRYQLSIHLSSINVLEGYDIPFEVRQLRKPCLG